MFHESLRYAGVFSWMTARLLVGHDTLIHLYVLQYIV